MGVTTGVTGWWAWAGEAWENTRDCRIVFFSCSCSSDSLILILLIILPLIILVPLLILIILLILLCIQSFGYRLCKEEKKGRVNGGRKGR